MAELVGLPRLAHPERGAVFATILEHAAETMRDAVQSLGPEPDVDEAQYALSIQGDIEHVECIAAAARKQRPQRWWLGAG